MIRGKTQTENIVKRGTFVGNTVKRVPVFYILSTLFRVCFAILGLFKHWYQADLEAPPGICSHIADF